MVAVPFSISSVLVLLFISGYENVQVIYLFFLRKEPNNNLSSIMVILHCDQRHQRTTKWSWCSQEHREMADLHVMSQTGFETPFSLMWKNCNLGTQAQSFLAMPNKPCSCLDFSIVITNLVLPF